MCIKALVVLHQCTSRHGLSSDASRLEDESVGVVDRACREAIAIQMQE